MYNIMLCKSINKRVINTRFIRKPILYALHESIGHPISNNLGANTNNYLADCIGIG